MNGAWGRRLGISALAAELLAGCAAHAPYDPTRLYVYQPYAPAGQPDMTAIDIEPGAAQPARPRRMDASMPIAPPLPIPSSTIHPPRPAARDLDGPVRICKNGLSIDVLAGEHAREGDRSVTLDGPAGDLGIDGWIYSPEMTRSIFRLVSTIDVPGLGTVQRFDLLAPPPGAPRIVYRFDTRERSQFPMRILTSRRFDGSAVDGRLMERIRSGAHAARLCEPRPAGR